ncbi:MAG: hydroxyethylthiazole kinase [Candidatus Limnocylindrales bacterium]
MVELDLAELTAASLERIRDRTPLVHNITNFVVMNDTANVLLAIGASPVMAHAIEEVREMVSYAGALVLNIGTLDNEWVESMLIAGEEANARKVPVVLDPVGAGATALRTATSQQILDNVTVASVRGNAGELATIAGLGGEVRGVDSVSADSPDAAARVVARRTGGAAVASGMVDYVSDATRLAEVRNGHALMGRITGSGCMATALVGAFLAVESDPFLASVEAMIAFGIAGEAAAEISAGPGTFRANLIDAVSQLDRAAILAGCRATARVWQPA